MEQNEIKENPWWARNRFTHFIVVARDLSWRIIRNHKADIPSLIMAVRVSWNLTRKEAA